MPKKRLFFRGCHFSGKGGRHPVAATLSPSPGDWGKCGDWGDCGKWRFRDGRPKALSHRNEARPRQLRQLRQLL